MTTTNSELQQLYDRAAREFAARLWKRYPETVHSIVLYGSVARNTAGANSDIDVMVLTKNGRPTRDELVELSESVDFENRYDTFVVATRFTPDRLRDLATGGFPIAEAIFNEGRVLYDDGTFERLRHDASKARG
jgi:predicted nucleotidyltransferase